MELAARAHIKLAFTFIGNTVSSNRYRLDRENFMNFTTRTLALMVAAGAFTQLAACATYQQPYPQQGYAQVQQPGTYPIYQAQPACANGMLSDPMVNAVVGGALGGLAGNQFGKGSGKSAMTALGAVAGVVAGQQVAQASHAQCY